MFTENTANGIKVTNTVGKYHHKHWTWNTAQASWYQRHLAFSYIYIYKTLTPIPHPTHPLLSLPLLTFDPWVLNSEKNPGTVVFLQTDSPRTILIWRWGERHMNTQWATKRERDRVVGWLGEVGVVGWERLTARSRSVALTSKTPSPTVQVSGILRE